MVVPQADGVTVTIPSPKLLGIFTDYLKTLEQEKPWLPFKLTLQQKCVLIWLSTLDPSTVKDGSGWISFFKEHHLETTVSDWLEMQTFGWFTEKENHLLALDADKINYFVTALKYEQNIKGTV